MYMCAYACFLCVHVMSTHVRVCAKAKAFVYVSGGPCICVWACGMFMHMCACMWGAQVGLEDPESPPEQLLCSGSGSLTVCSHYLMTPILQVRKLG